uniref:Ferredoxin-thioredoxin reductase, variable chain-like n=1 Tax=Tanacetum cinerariifolium TaxID=118510 RepID=A0A699K1F0_TANCI|nr:ferredoxin-thioredoxin reductase, variable chain-like [Tanacetum cinerariifolium]
MKHRHIPPNSLTFTNPNITNPKPNPHRLTITVTTATSSDSTTIINTPKPQSSQGGKNSVKVGARVRVKVPLKVYHVPKVSEVELNGKEGKIKENIAVWKGKYISASFPIKVEFFEVLEGRGNAPVKFFAHLKQDEFEYID